MAKASKPKPTKAPKEIATQYEEKVSFDDTFEQMIDISGKDAEKKSATVKHKQL